MMGKLKTTSLLHSSHTHPDKTKVINTIFKAYQVPFKFFTQIHYIHQAQLGEIHSEPHKREIGNLTLFHHHAI